MKNKRITIAFLTAFLCLGLASGFSAQNRNRVTAKPTATPTPAKGVLSKPNPTPLPTFTAADSVTV